MLDTPRGPTDPDSPEPMPSILTRAAAWLLNRLPPHCAALASEAVVVEAIRQMGTDEADLIAEARARLQLQRLRDEIAALRAEVDRQG